MVSAAEFFGNRFIWYAPEQRDQTLNAPPPQVGFLAFGSNRFWIVLTVVADPAQKTHVVQGVAAIPPTAFDVRHVPRQRRTGFPFHVATAFNATLLIPLEARQP
jgi:hypothetical protein